MRRGTGARGFSSISPGVKSSVMAKPAPGGSWASTTSHLQHHWSGDLHPRHVLLGSQLWCLPCVAIPIPTPVPLCWHRVEQAELVSGVPCPFLSICLAVGMLRSLQTIPGTSSGSYQLRDRVASLERVPSPTKASGFLSGRILLPRADEPRVPDQCWRGQGDAGWLVRNAQGAGCQLWPGMLTPAPAAAAPSAHQDLHPLLQDQAFLPSAFPTFSHPQFRSWDEAMQARRARQ